MKKKKLTAFGKAVFSLLIIAAVAILYLCLRPLISPVQATASAESSPTATATPTPDPMAEQKETYSERKTVNPDYIGELAFESGLVDQNVVQSADNEKYLNLSWDLQNSTHGAAFLDYRNQLSDQNLIIYGHYVYADESLMFSPLHQLKDQAAYEANQYIDLKLADKTIRYQVTDVFYYEMNNANLMYYITNYDTDYFNTYIATVKQKDFYDSGISLTMDDRWITLQTCVRNRDDLRLIVLAKETD